MILAQFIFGVYFAVLGAVVSVWLAKVVKQNGTVLTKMDEGFTRMDKRFDETLRLISRLIVEENERSRKGILQALAK